MSWSKLKLGELTRIRTGKLDANAADEDGIYPFFTCAVEPLLINIPAFDCKAVLVAGNGDLNVKYHEGKFNAYQRTYVIESIDTNKLHPKFLYYFLSDYIVELRELSIGGVIKYIKLGNLTDAKIPLPPIAEQKRIAAILDKANEIKVKHELTLAKLNVLAQSIFIDMFGDPEKNLMGWEYRKLSDLVTKLGDGIHGTPAYSEDGEYYFINGNNLHHGVITTSATTKKVSFDEFNKHKRELNKSTMLVSINGTIGKVAFYNEEKIILGKSACYFNANESLINKTYLFYLIESPYFIKYATSTATGSTIKNVSLKSMRNFPIPMPPLALQEKYFKQIESIEKIKSIASRAVIKQKYLLSSLQNQAFTTGFNA